MWELPLPPQVCLLPLGPASPFSVFPSPSHPFMGALSLSPSLCPASPPSLPSLSLSLPCTVSLCLCLSHPWAPERTDSCSPREARRQSGQLRNRGGCRARRPGEAALHSGWGNGSVCGGGGAGGEPGRAVGLRHVSARRGLRSAGSWRAGGWR